MHSLLLQQCGIFFFPIRIRIRNCPRSPPACRKQSIPLSRTPSPHTACFPAMISACSSPRGSSQKRRNPFPLILIFRRILPIASSASATHAPHSRSSTLQLKTKEMTYTRISRALMHLLLNQKTLYPAGYNRVLGFRKSAGALLKEIRRRSSLPLIAKAADAPRLLTGDALAAFESDIQASRFLRDCPFSQNRDTVRP